MEKFEFNGETFTKSEVSRELPKKINSMVKSVNPLANKCLENSGKMAQKSGAKMVEGYLVTAFQDKEEVECVGHVWNEYQDV